MYRYSPCFLQCSPRERKCVFDADIHVIVFGILEVVSFRRVNTKDGSNNGPYFGVANQETVVEVSPRLA